MLFRHYMASLYSILLTLSTGPPRGPQGPTPSGPQGPTPSGPQGPTPSGPQGPTPSDPPGPASGWSPGARRRATTQGPASEQIPRDPRIRAPRAFARRRMLSGVR